MMRANMGGLLFKLAVSESLRLPNKITNKW